MRFIGNPAWSNNVLTENWQAVEKRVGKAMMPRATRKGEKIVAKEYGTGHFGVVFPTNKPGVVAKITTDTAEAMFVQMLVSGKIKAPPGIVKYYDVVQLAGSHNKRPVFMLWREEAFDVGKVVKDDTSQEKELMRLRFLATYPYNVVSSPDQQYVKTMQKQARESLASKQHKCDVRVFTDPGKLAGEMIAEWVRSASALKSPANVGPAMAAVARQGIMLADVHADNVGVAKRNGKRVVVITDPGVALPISDKVKFDLPPTINRSVKKAKPNRLVGYY